MESVLQIMMNEKFKELEVRKTELVKSKLKEYFLLLREECPDFETEKRRRFPRLSKSTNESNNTEHWYWNDGSHNGYRLISFNNFDPQINEHDGKLSVEVWFTYQ